MNQESSFKNHVLRYAAREFIDLIFVNTVSITDHLRKKELQVISQTV